VKNAIGAVLAFLLAGAPAARAADNFLSGSACTQYIEESYYSPTNNTVEYITRSGGHFSNWDSTKSRGALCAAPFGDYNNATIYAQVSYTDQSTTDSVYCRVEARTSSGGSYLTSYLYSCSTFGGCPSATATPSYTGTGTLAWSNPLNNGGTMYSLVSLDIYCGVPASPSAGILSSINGYEMNTTY
jgi:hypothetical protein